MREIGEDDRRVRQVQDLIPDAWDKGPISLAHELLAMLKSIVDDGTHIDSGGGDGVADLWPIVGGVEYYVSIKTKLTMPKPTP